MATEHKLDRPPSPRHPESRPSGPLNLARPADRGKHAVHLRTPHTLHPRRDMNSGRGHYLRNGPLPRSSCTAPRSMCHVVRLTQEFAPQHLCSWLCANPGPHHCSTTRTPHAHRALLPCRCMICPSALSSQPSCSPPLHSAPCAAPTGTTSPAMWLLDCGVL